MLSLRHPREAHEQPMAQPQRAKCPGPRAASVPKINGQSQPVETGGCVTRGKGFSTALRPRFTQRPERLIPAESPGLDGARPAKVLLEHRIHEQARSGDERQSHEQAERAQRLPAAREHRAAPNDGCGDARHQRRPGAVVIEELNERLIAKAPARGRRPEPVLEPPIPLGEMKPHTQRGENPQGPPEWRACARSRWLRPAGWGCFAPYIHRRKTTGQRLSRP